MGAIILLWEQFLRQDQVLTKLVVLFKHWFMPYKVKRGKVYFQCGTKPKKITSATLGLDAKIAPTT